MVMVTNTPEEFWSTSAFRERISQLLVATSVLPDWTLEFFDHLLLLVSYSTKTDVRDVGYSLPYIKRDRCSKGSTCTFPKNGAKLFQPSFIPSSFVFCFDTLEKRGWSHGNCRSIICRHDQILSLLHSIRM